MAKGIAGSSLTQTSDDLTAGWIGEAEKRIAAFREGTMAAVDGRLAMTGLKARFAR